MDASDLGPAVTPAMERNDLNSRKRQRSEDATDVHERRPTPLVAPDTGDALFNPQRLQEVLHTKRAAVDRAERMRSHFLVVSKCLQEVIEMSSRIADAEHRLELALASEKAAQDAEKVALTTKENTASLLQTSNLRSEASFALGSLGIGLILLFRICKQLNLTLEKIRANAAEDRNEALTREAECFLQGGSHIGMLLLEPRGCTIVKLGSQARMLSRARSMLPKAPHFDLILSNIFKECTPPPSAAALKKVSQNKAPDSPRWILWMPWPPTRHNVARIRRRLERGTEIIDLTEDEPTFSDESLFWCWIRQTQASDSGGYRYVFDLSQPKILSTPTSKVAIFGISYGKSLMPSRRIPNSQTTRPLLSLDLDTPTSKEDADTFYDNLHRLKCPAKHRDMYRLLENEGRCDEYEALQVKIPTTVEVCMECQN
ncbi:hypothetical protein BKA62DRAFT_673697 [Auriculariales sp. MPI-PUGE-AT-0066]|nr:hypothetical protein BKA62DRAFT_673697 [Auriculariales sp. MPI-PUGE-AT-0066]